MENEKMIEKMVELNSFVIHSITEMKKISENTMLELAKQQMESIEEFNKISARQVTELTTVKSPQELLDSQAAIASDAAQDMKNRAQQVLAILSSSQSQMQDFITQNVQQFVDKTLKAA
ncbi:MAG: phasin family protein [Magnetococcales bacterium]|nr:phasin family protein [Magnetococcales bacterium]